MKIPDDQIKGREMQGLLADVNVQGHTLYLRHLLQSLPEWPLIAELNLRLVTFQEVDFPVDLDDRALWSRCQQEGWVLFTDNRNHDGPDSLEMTLRDSWQEGHLPVLTLSNKRHFENDRMFALNVAIDLAELLFGILEQRYRSQPRIYVPLTPRRLRVTN